VLLGSYPLQPSSTLTPTQLASSANRAAKFESEGALDPISAYYGVPGAQPVFLIEAAHISGGVDFAQGLRTEAAAQQQLYPDNPGAFTISTPHSGHANYTCLTITGRTEGATCVWQGAGAVVLGVGANMAADDAVALIADARAAMHLS
jgi:hypothetical protein